MLTDHERFNKLIDLVTQATSWDLAVDEELQKLKYPEEPSSGILKTECKGPRYENPIEKPKQSKFEIGDRVAVYTDSDKLIGWRGTGVVTDIVDSERNTLGVIIDLTKEHHWFHIKQCRRLRKKK